MGAMSEPSSAAPSCPHHATRDSAAAPLFCPVYPRPRPGRIASWLMFFRARKSWMHSLFERSYRMKMGEVHLFGRHVYMVNEPKWVRHVMVDAVAQYPKHELLGKALQPLLGESIFTTNGAQWARQRKMMNPAFEQARIAVAFPLMLDAAQAMVQRLDALPDGAQADVEIEMTHVTADIIFRTILSTPMQGEDARRIFANFAEFQELAPRLAMPVIYGLNALLPLLVPFWQVRRSRHAAANIRSLLGRLIRPRYDAHRALEAAGGEKLPPRDILGSLLDARDEATGEAMPFEEALDEVAMLFWPATRPRQVR